MGPSGLEFTNQLGEGDDSKSGDTCQPDMITPFPLVLFLLMKVLVFNIGFNYFCLDKGTKRQLTMAFLQSQACSGGRTLPSCLRYGECY